MTRTADGSAGDADYGVIGDGYRQYRRPEPSFERAISRALGDARTVLNVGAGAGSYEPRDREVTAVEPSASMRAQRPAGLSTAIDATAEALPFGDDTFDASMTTFSVHQWSDVARGLAEMRRVTRGPVVVMQLLLAFFGYSSAVDAGRPLVGIPILVLVATELYLLATPEARLAFSDR